MSHALMRIATMASYDETAETSGRGTPGIDGAGSGLTDGSAWLIALVALLALVVVARWARGRRR